MLIIFATANNDNKLDPEIDKTDFTFENMHDSGLEPCEDLYEAIKQKTNEFKHEILFTTNYSNISRDQISTYCKELINKNRKANLIKEMCINLHLRMESRKKLLNLAKVSSGNELYIFYIESQLLKIEAYENKFREFGFKNIDNALLDILMDQYEIKSIDT